MGRVYPFLTHPLCRQATAVNARSVCLESRPFIGEPRVGSGLESLRLQVVSGSVGLGELFFEFGLQCGPLGKVPVPDC